ncbi:MAG TPA: response regulator [Ktedonobacteraceae bacterium]
MNIQTSEESSIARKQASRFCRQDDSRIEISEGRGGQLLIGLFEDDLAIQEMLRLLLQSEGYNVAAYSSMEECLAHMHADDSQPCVARPDLLMIDLHLAKSLSGLAVIERIRANPSLEHFPVILMTASTVIDRQNLQRLSVTLLPKPFDIDEIIRIVGELATA